MAKLRLSPRNTTVAAPRGASLLALVSREGAPLGQACRGQGVCRSCRVEVLEGAAHLGPPTDLETRWALEPGWRLACQARIFTADDAPGEIVLWSPTWGLRPGPAPDAGA